MVLAENSVQVVKEVKSEDDKKPYEGYGTLDFGATTLLVRVLEVCGPPHNIASFYGPSCANIGKGALNLPPEYAALHILQRHRTSIPPPTKHTPRIPSFRFAVHTNNGQRGCAQLPHPRASARRSAQQRFAVRGQQGRARDEVRNK
eukprot:2977518-Pyramimonas_sp.AAC.2